MGSNVVAGDFFTAVEKPGESLMISLRHGVITTVSALGTYIVPTGDTDIWWTPAVSELMCLAVMGVLMYRSEKY